MVNCVVHGVEYAFGAHDHSKTGVFEVEPKQCPGFTFRKSILIGRTDLGAKDVRTLIEKLSKEYLGNTYHLISKNCNHFCNDLCMQLTRNSIPRWVNRLARLGLLCKCVLPASLDETKVCRIRADNKVSDADKKKLRSQSSRFGSSNSTSSTSSTLTDCSAAPASRSRRQRRCVPPSASLLASYSQRETVS